MYSSTHVAWALALLLRLTLLASGAQAMCVVLYAFVSLLVVYSVKYATKVFAIFLKW